MNQMPLHYSARTDIAASEGDKSDEHEHDGRTGPGTDVDQRDRRQSGHLNYG